jgi:predicted ferric reductase
VTTVPDVRWSQRAWTIGVWTIVGLAVTIPLVAAATSPLLAWRRPVYIVSGLAGVIGLAVLLFQPLLIGRMLPGLPPRRSRQLHRWSGALLVAAVVVHVGGLFITSPPDVIDALVFESPTAFSPFGVVAMWAVFATALLAACRRWLRLDPRVWRIGHTILAVVIVVSTVMHCLLIEGTMETVSRAVLCALIVMATAKVMADAWLGMKRRSVR